MPEQQVAGRRFAYWVAHTLRTEREQAGIEQKDMAIAIGVDRATIRRLEKGESFGHDIDDRIAAYAYVLGIEDNRDLWRRALDAWMSHGEPSIFREEGGPAAFARWVREAAQRARQAPGVQPRNRVSKRMIREAC